MAATPSSSNTLFGRGAVLFDRFDANGVAQGQYSHLGNCDNFAVSITTDVAELKDFTASSSAVYNSAVKQTNVNVKISGFEVATKVMAVLVLGDITTYTQTVFTAIAQSTTLVPASLTGVKGSFFKVGNRNISLPTLVQGGTTLVSGTDYEIFDASAGVFRILSAGAAADATAITVNYTAAAIAAGATALDVVRAGTTANIKGSLLFLPSNSTGPLVEVRAYNVSLSPDGDIGLISDDWLKWNMKGTVNSDSAGTYGGSTAEPYFRTITR
jgi:hypothetical protein